MTNREVVKAFYDSLIEMDLEKFKSIQHSDVIYDISGHTILSGRYKSLDALMAILPHVFEALDFTTFQFAKKWKIMCEQDDFIVVIMEADGLNKEGVTYDQRYVHMFGFREGKISRLIEFFDTELANNVLGLKGKEQCKNDGEFEI